MSTARLTQTIRAALLAAVWCLLAPVSLPLGPVPVSLGTFCLYLTAGLLPPLYAAQAVGLYLLLGLCGLPVFAGFQSGFGALLGPAGGFLMAYLPAVLLAAWLGRRGGKGAYPLALTAATLLLYGCGTLWYAYTTGVTATGAALVCVVPFLPGDAAKLAVACGLCPHLRKRIFCKSHITD